MRRIELVSRGVYILLITMGWGCGSEVSPSKTGLNFTLEVSDSLSDKWKALDGGIEWAVKEGQVPGAVLLVVEKGQVLLHRAYGEANPWSKESMTTETMFRICSQSKAITATSAMVLWERGLIDLDAPVSKYLPEFEGIGILDSLYADTSFTTIPTPKLLTVRHLMTHTSGIPYGEIGDKRFQKLYAKHDIVDLFPRDGRTTLENANKLAQTCLAHAPGEAWTYGLGLDVLVAVIEAASGQSYSEFLRVEILEPLGMYDTHFVVPEESSDRLVRVSERAGEEAGKWLEHTHLGYTVDYPVQKNWPLCSGGAGLTSTSSDYGRFLQMYLDRGAIPGGRLLKESTVDTIMADHAPGLIEGAWTQGLAFGVKSSGPGIGRFFWGGYFNTQYYAEPETNTLVVLMKQTFGVEQDSSARAFDALLWD